MRIESISIKNFKGFRNAVMTDIPPFCVVIGANGSGKSTLFDVFGFLRDCLKNDVIRALQAWGGFSQVISRKTGFQTASLRFRHGCGKAGCKKRRFEVGKNRLQTACCGFLSVHDSHARYTLYFSKSCLARIFLTSIAFSTYSILSAAILVSDSQKITPVGSFL